MNRNKQFNLTLSEDDSARMLELLNRQKVSESRPSAAPKILALLGVSVMILLIIYGVFTGVLENWASHFSDILKGMDGSFWQQLKTIVLN